MSRLIRIAAVSALGLSIAGCAASQPRVLNARSNYSVYSVHQPVVEHTNYVFDLRVDGDRVSEAELNRLAAWFHSIGARSTAASVSDAVSSSKRRLPVIISQSTVPNAQMSARRSTPVPRACSGLM